MDRLLICGVVFAVFIFVFLPQLFEMERANAHWKLGQLFRKVNAINYFLGLSARWDMFSEAPTINYRIVIEYIYENGPPVCRYINDPAVRSDMWDFIYFRRLNFERFITGNNRVARVIRKNYAQYLFDRKKVPRDHLKEVRVGWEWQRISCAAFALDLKYNFSYLETYCLADFLKAEYA